MAHKDREVRLAYHRQYHLTHKEAESVQRKHYLATHKEAENQRSRAYNIAHKDEIDAYRIKYMTEHKQEELARGREYRSKHRVEDRIRAKEYARTHKPERAERQRRRDAMERGTTVISISPRAIYERDKWRCGLCGKHVSRKDRSLDHIIPLSKGGAHVEWNVQLAHLKCNLIKNVGRLPSQTRLPIAL